MNLLTRAAAVALSFSFFATGALALSLREGAQPAEVPPSSYTSSTYVDSRGCIYIRAGYGGAVTWVPQVTRDRKVVCGARPSLAGAAATPAPESSPRQAPAPSVASAPATPAREPAPARAPAPAPTAPQSTEIARTVILTCPEGGADRQVRADGIRLPLRCEAGQSGRISYIVRHANGERTRVIVKPASPATTIAEAPPPAPAPAPAPAAAGSACPERTGVSAAHTNATGVRCGPQTTPAVPTGAAVAARVSASPPAATAPTAPARAVAPPPGYRTAWEDDRLNPNRGPRGQENGSRMDLIWSHTTPRRLYDAHTGRDVTSLFPRLRYPDLPTGAQIRQALLSASGTASSATVTSSSAAPTVRPSEPAGTSPSAAAASYRFVQVAMFAVPANARNTVRKLQQMGLPVRIGKLTRNGRQLQIVAAGPFSRQSELTAALARVRAAGFSDAYPRN